MFSRTQKLKWKYWYPISVEIDYQLHRLRKFIDRLYLKIWPYIFAAFIALWSTWAYLQIKHDYNLIHNYANLDFANSDFYTKWRTDGSPGQDPPR